MACPPLQMLPVSSKMHHSLHAQTPPVKAVRERRFEGGTDGFSRPASGAERDHAKSCKRHFCAVLLLRKDSLHRESMITLSDTFG